MDAQLKAEFEAKSEAVKAALTHACREQLVLALLDTAARYVARYIKSNPLPAEATEAEQKELVHGMAVIVLFEVIGDAGNTLLSEQEDASATRH